MRGLVFSGGGSKGQFHVGVVKYLLGEQGTVYDVYGGVSVGALVAAFLAQYATGHEREAAIQLWSLFSDINNERIWQRWFPFGKLHGLWKSSVLDSRPLRRLLRAEFSQGLVAASGKKLRIGAVSLTTGAFELFTEQHPHLLEAISASASYPVFFRPVEIPEHGLYTDGGVRQVTPIKSLIDAGCDSIDVVICHPQHLRVPAKKCPSALDIAALTIDLMSDEIIWRDVKMAQLYNKLLASGQAPNKRHVELRVISPDRILNTDSLKFDPQEAHEIRLIGYGAASGIA